MPMESFDRVLLPAAMLLFLGAGMVLPSVRVRRLTGAAAFVFHRGGKPHQRLVGLAFGVCVGGLAAWSVLFGVLGASGVGAWAPPVWLRAPGYLMLAAGLLLLVLAERDMGASWRIGIADETTGLVTGGLFSVVRNPVFASMLLALAGAVALAPSGVSIAGWLLAVALIGLQARLEERHLLEIHGEAYRAYASRVGRFLPGVGRLGRPAPGGGDR